jgi:type I restriction enzyme R subunit
MDSPASSFAFLAPYGPLYLRLATAAERTLAIDPSLTLVSLRQLAEAFARYAAARANLMPDGRDGAVNQIDLLRLLEQRGIVRDQIAEIFHVLRKAGNKANHDFVGNHQDALNGLQVGFKLACWFHRTFGDSHARTAWKPPVYQPPPDPTATLRALRDEAAKARAEADAHKADADKARLLLEAEAARRDEEAALRAAAEAERREWETLAHAYEQDLTQAAAAQAALVEAAAAEAARAPTGTTERIVEQSAAAAKATELDEAETRVLIDAQLRDAGWEVDSRALRWAAGARPEKGKHRAIAEVPTWTKADGKGSADYVLFIGLVPYAVVEAKKQAKKVPSTLEQSKRYARGLAATLSPPLADHAAEGPMSWSTTLAATGSATADRYHVPFLYATNGRPYLRQLETESGVWFLDARHPTNHPRALTGWHTPEALVHLRAHDPAAAQAKLAAEPTDALQQALDLRSYQVRAITAVEAALGRGQRALLVAMATGTGKTRTVIGLIHRLLKSQRFRRVLFLVDRGTLGKQAYDAFHEVRLENLQTFAQNYDVMGLAGATPAKETMVHVATVQGMVKRILWSSPDEPPVPIDRYDCVIIDESHRGYTLDREMTEGEQELRGFEDYVSTYRRVLDHFDAVKIGLTATPAQHTLEIFGAPVFVYSYPQAVADGWLVDHEPPVRITTRLAKYGITFEKGAEVETYLGRGETQLALLPDELAFDVASFNRTVITDGFNRAVAEELAQHLDPHGEAKTIVFCVDDDHAERLVPILKAALTAAWGPIDDAVVQKITGATDRVDDAIARFKNEALPKIAITVDLLSTGVDVPRVSNIVFLRRIRSRILYDQMLGRATRLCPEIGKEAFHIYDAVGLYDVLAPVSEMKPLVKNVSRTTRELVTELLDPRAAHRRRPRRRPQPRRRGPARRGRAPAPRGPPHRQGHAERGPGRHHRVPRGHPRRAPRRAAPGAAHRRHRRRDRALHRQARAGAAPRPPVGAARHRQDRDHRAPRRRGDRRRARLRPRQDPPRGLPRGLHPLRRGPPQPARRAARGVHAPARSDPGPARRAVGQAHRRRLLPDQRQASVEGLEEPGHRRDDHRVHPPARAGLAARALRPARRPRGRQGAGHRHLDQPAEAVARAHRRADEARDRGRRGRLPQGRLRQRRRLEGRRSGPRRPAQASDGRPRRRGLERRKGSVVRDLDRRHRHQALEPLPPPPRRRHLVSPVRHRADAALVPEDGQGDREGRSPAQAGCRWDDLKALPPGGDQLDAYKAMLLNLGRAKDPLVKAIYTGAQTALREPRFVTQLVGAIDDLNWFSAKTDGLGAMYEGLLEKNASETKSGAGQYFTPRPLIEAMVEVMKPQAGEIVQDPAAGTAGFLIAADTYVKRHTDDHFTLSLRRRRSSRRPRPSWASSWCRRPGAWP